eukprot:TRINITY_DN68031_c0_g1_i1.p2 TRINITY_DN68031_c0_g1~~TRINITY_DN68031_c0_g1_i1.p2  ORF type:complete len:105 (+),score=16.23 TRINITY_DN68031_c0_g1_i1:198-512(+)
MPASTRGRASLRWHLTHLLILNASMLAASSPVDAMTAGWARDVLEDGSSPSQVAVEASQSKDACVQKSRGASATSLFTVAGVGFLAGGALTIGDPLQTVLLSVI